MRREVLSIAAAMISKTTLPDIFVVSKAQTKLLRVSAFDQLYCALEGLVASGRDEEMDVFGHDDECMQKK